MKHYLGTVAYRGTSYSGFQRQSSLRTIQGELERALSTLIGRCVTVVPISVIIGENTVKEIHKWQL